MNQQDNSECPTCKGKGYVFINSQESEDCPTCLAGYTTLPQQVKTGTVEEVANNYAKLADPLNQTLEKQADIRMGFIAGYNYVQSNPERPNKKSAEEIFNTIAYLDKSGDFFNMQRTHVIEAMEIYASQPQWRETAKELPENAQWILAFYANTGEYQIHSFDTIRKLPFDYWMPLPENPTTK